MEWLFGGIGVLLTSIVGGFAGSFLTGYAQRRGSNTADLLDRRVLALEEALGKQPVDQDNARHAAELAASNQLRFAAMERRLKAHQEAYAWSKRLWRTVRPENLLSEEQKELDEVQRFEIFDEARGWWENNCLYLEPDVRTSFLSACYGIGAPSHLRKVIGQDFKVENDLIALDRAVWQAVKLPPLQTPDQKVSDSLDDEVSQNN